MMSVKAPRFLTHNKRLLNPESWLERSGAAYCIMSGSRLPCILRATAPFVYVRLHGPDQQRVANDLWHLGDEFGVLLVQLPPLFGYDYARLEYFLAQASS